LAKKNYKTNVNRSIVPHKHTNSLINETSPYLLQHAHNPVNWFAWNKEVFELAKKEDKPVLVSIGYSACHWCHVMEHESFEDEQTAKIMNDLFINIKVDREERPDVDQVYMTAVQLMTGRGGWPLNCIVLPDGRPIYGGTYFPKQQWQNILLHIADLWKNDSGKILDYATQLTEGVKQSELISVNTNEAEFSIKTLHQTVSNWKQRFDNAEGGPNRAPKFPLPNNYQFLLRYANVPSLTLPEGERTNLLQHVNLTLKKMAFGGIYDQIGGGFARYSTDMMWKVPHFEKMLYDNGQLVTLYAEAFQATKNELYKDVVYETIDFIKRELTSPESAFYSALDADSEGEEGKYYVWTKEELQNILKEKYDLAVEYYNLNELGYWEHDNYILLRDKTDAEVAKKLNISVEKLKKEITLIKSQLLTIREKRIKPGLDDKSLTSWNALMLKGLIDAYRVFDEKEFLMLALKNAEFIISKQLKKDGSLFHSYKKGRSTINGFLEDYAFTIEAFIALYQSTFDEQWLDTAKKLMKYTIEHFHDKENGMFYFTSDTDEALIARKTEVSDNVNPASCSSIAKSLFMLGHYYGNTAYIAMSKQMLNNVIREMPQYGDGYSNWAMLLLHFTTPFYEVAIVGKHVDEIRKAFDKLYLPNVIFAYSRSASQIPLLMNRFVDGKTLIYVCENSTCKAPVENVEDALSVIQSGN
jgi:uncharacterized protein YyaL (SSP411 family)